LAWVMLNYRTMQRIASLCCWYWFYYYYYVEALCYKPEGRGFESRWGGFFQLT
jgi:hypothetical protein